MAKKEMIKRKDGSYSQRGLWDNIRANKGSGKTPTKSMLKQEKKIKASTKSGKDFTYVLYVFYSISNRYAFVIEHIHSCALYV